MVGDELAPADGHGLEHRSNLRIHREQLGGIPLSPLLPVRCWIDRDELGGDDPCGVGHANRIEPDVGIFAIVLVVVTVLVAPSASAEGDRLDEVADLDHVPAVGGDVRQHIRQAFFEPQSVGDNEMRIQQLGHLL